ncbi:MAG: FTR1 family protein, partial [Helicobacter sp.]|nr:FTR1 family protein [Helicobacter sp.]
KKRSSKEFIIGGALVGVSFSLLIAITLSYLLPVATAGTNREIIEGAVGILAVILMLFIGAWLHNKSSIANWKAFIQQQVGRTITKGNLLGLGGLSFLVVFREGAETILFYAGIMPQITLESLLSGIAIALIGLIIVAYLMKVFTQKLPIHLMFGAMSWLIYIIGFKILGVSIHALQLTNILPIHILSLPSIAIFGFYNTIEGIMAQAVYLILIFVIIAWQKYSHTPIQSK